MTFRNKQDQLECQRKHYRNNKLAYKKRKTEHRDKIRLLMSRYKAELGCSSCPEKHIACLDFHHLGDKEINLSKCANAGWSWERILKEIKKCKILCSNCHRKLHYEEKIIADESTGS